MDIDHEPISYNTATKLRDKDVQIQKMMFIYNAVEAGWTVKKVADKYIFTQKHGGNREVYLENYLRNFLENNLSTDVDIRHVL